MKKTLKGLVTAGMIGLASLFPIKNVNAQDNKINASVELIQSKDDPVSFIRPNIFYKLFGLDNYSFFEFYRNENFFGKTIISKDLGVRVKPTAELVYGSGFDDRCGLGANYAVPMPNGASLNVKALPVWFNKKGYIDDRVTVGYFGTLKLPLDFNLSAFGEANIASKDGAQWGYGEISLGKNLSDNFRIAYNPLLKNQGKLAPRLEHAVAAKYTF